MLTDMFQELWAKVREERRQKLEKAVEQMLTSNKNQGILVVENQFGVIKSADLNPFVPFGEVMFVKKDDDFDFESFRRSVSSSEERG